MTLHKAWEIFITIYLILATYNAFLNLVYLRSYYKKIEGKLGFGWGIFGLLSGFVLGLIPILNVIMIWNYVWDMNEMVDSAINIHNEKE